MGRLGRLAKVQISKDYDLADHDTSKQFDNQAENFACIMTKTPKPWRLKLPAVLWAT
jgi:hypothetical protein